jgi:hypothetical protein
MTHCREKGRFGLIRGFRLYSGMLSGVALPGRNLLALFEFRNISMDDKAPPIRQRVPVCFYPAAMAKVHFIMALPVKKTRHSIIHLPLDLGARLCNLPIIELPPENFANVTELIKQIAG